MRIGVLLRSLSTWGGGVTEAARRLAQSVERHEVSVFGMRDASALNELSAWGPLPLSAVGSVGPAGYGYAPTLVDNLVSAQPNLLHVHGLWTYASLAALRWQWRTDRPYVVSPHGMLDKWALDQSSWKKRAVSCVYEDSFLQKAACLHALCESEVVSIRRRGLMGPICVIPNGVDLNQVPVGARADWARRLPVDSKILLYLGRIHPKKGLEELVRAFAKICESHKDWHLVIAGWGQDEHQSGLSGVVEALNLNLRVHLVGPQIGEDKWLSYRSADAFVLPSKSEGLPMVVLEAWASSLPVLMTPACNLPEGYATGAAIEIRCSQSHLSGQLANFFSLPPGAWHEIGRRGADLVREKFTWPMAAAAFEQVYEWVAGRGSRPPFVVAE